jgi:hypothetical protein
MKKSNFILFSLYYYFHYQVTLQAHNDLGFSSESSLIVKSSKGEYRHFMVLEKFCFYSQLWKYMPAGNSKDIAKWSGPLFGYRQQQHRP